MVVWLVLLCSCLGLFLTAMLSVAHVYGASLYCGASDDCGLVAASKLAAPMGIPVAFCGFGFYLSVCAASVAWIIKRKVFGIAPITWLCVGVAAASSVLTILAAIRLHAHCVWCISSNVVSIALALIFLLTDGRTWAVPEIGKMRRWPLSVMACLLGTSIAVGAVGLRSSSVVHGLKAEVLARLTLTDLAPADSLTVGAKSSDKVVVAFTDLECAACRGVLPFLVRSAKSGAFRLVVRMYPMPSHAGAFEASLALAKATVAGRGLEFLTAGCDLGDSGLEGIDNLARDLRTEELTPAAEASAEAIVRRDLSLAHQLGVNRTPTLLLLSGPHSPTVISVADLQRLLGVQLDEG